MKFFKIKYFFTKGKNILKLLNYLIFLKVFSILIKRKQYIKNINFTYVNFFIYILLVFALNSCHKNILSEGIELKFGKLWKICKESIEFQNYELEIENEDKGIIETAWNEKLSGYNYKGIRKKINLKIIKNKFKEIYKIKITILKEKNIQLNNTLKSNLAIWNPYGRDLQEEKLLLEIINKKVYLTSKKEF